MSALSARASGTTVRTSPNAWGRARAQADAALVKARLTVVPHRGPVSAPRLPFLMLVSAVLVGGIVGLLCFNTQMQQSSFAVATLEQRAASLEARQQTLAGELEALRSPQHLAVLAAKSGMVSPQNACTLRLGVATSGECTAAVRGTTPSPFPPAPAKPRILDPRPQVVQVAARTRSEGVDRTRARATTGRDTGAR